jgi:hypothetical protein
MDRTATKKDDERLLIETTFEYELVIKPDFRHQLFYVMIAMRERLWHWYRMDSYDVDTRIRWIDKSMQLNVSFWKS